MNPAVCSSARFTVLGTPAPKGSKSFKGFAKSGKAILVESSAAAKPWAEAVKWAAIENRCAHVPGPVTVRIVFTLPKPKGAPKNRTTYPSRAPDLDKLIRCTWDALVQVGLIEDDSRIIWAECGKVFPGEHADALPVPGALIVVTAAQTWLPLTRAP